MIRITEIEGYDLTGSLPNSWLLTDEDGEDYVVRTRNYGISVKTSPPIGSKENGKYILQREIHQIELETDEMMKELSDVFGFDENVKIDEL